LPAALLLRGLGVGGTCIKKAGVRKCAAVVPPFWDPAAAVVYAGED